MGVGVGLCVGLIVGVKAGVSVVRIVGDKVLYDCSVVWGCIVGSVVELWNMYNG